MMSPEWRSFLINIGAVVIDGRVMHFGNPSQETNVVTSGEVIADLSHCALIAVRGADAEKFLQGQLSNDILEVTATRSQISAQCSPKGRALTLFRIFRRDDALYLTLPETLLKSTLERLRKYVLMSKVTLDPETALAQMGYSSIKDFHHLRASLNSLPDTADAVTQVQGITVIRMPGPHPRFKLIGPAESLKTLWAQLDVHATPVGADAWQLLDILAGVPSLAPETVDAFVPQMINLDALHGINFNKGCYTGQEIVARTHYLGKLKRRMFLLHCNVDEPPVPATVLYSTAHRNDEGVGTVVAAQGAPNGGIVLLAVLQIDSAAQGELRLGGIDGPLCTIHPLPYSPAGQ
jgi:tRNA-modifying protein YgfZ